SFFRTIFAVIVAVGLASGQHVVSLGIVAAPSLSLLVVPLAFARRAQRQAQPAPDPGPPGGEAEDVPGIGAEDVPGIDSEAEDVPGIGAEDVPGIDPEDVPGLVSEPETGDGAAPEFSLRHGTGFAAAVLLIMFSEQTFLNAGPLIIHALQG